MSATSAWVGLAPPGNAGSWQDENKVIYILLLLVNHSFFFPEKIFIKVLATIYKIVRYLLTGLSILDAS